MLDEDVNGGGEGQGDGDGDGGDGGVGIGTEEVEEKEEEEEEAEEECDPYGEDLSEEVGGEEEGEETGGAEEDGGRRWLRWCGRRLVQGSGLFGGDSRRQRGGSWVKGGIRS